MMAHTRKTMQNILYLQCSSTSISSKAVGMAIVENGVLSDGPAKPEDWPYKSVLDAIRAGWRVVQFPIIAAAPLDAQLKYVPCEFILEKIVGVDEHE